MKQVQGLTQFEQKTMRLKLLLGVATDREVAAELGFLQAAWCARKVRDAFPERELFALLGRRPELRLDALYVLTGERRVDTTTSTPAAPAGSLTTRDAAAVLNFIAGDEPMSDYTNDGQQHILRLLMLLAGNEITGLTPTDIARQQDCSASVVTRDLHNLQLQGLAEKVPETGRWRLGPQVVQIGIKHLASLDRAEQRLAETRQRYSRNTEPDHPRAAANAGAAL